MKITRMCHGAMLMTPLLVGLIPFAVSTGIYGTEKGFAVHETVIMSLIVFAGASQVAMMDLLAQSAPIWIVVATALLINLRFMVFSAALSPYVQETPLWLRPFLAYTLVDQMFMLISADSNKIDKSYEWAGVGIMTFVFWHGSVWVGAYFGDIIPAYLSLEYALPVMFLFFGVNMLKNKARIVAASVTVLSIIVLYPLMPLGSGLMTSIILGAIAGIIMKRATA